jgi:hypothetical protein
MYLINIQETTHKYKCTYQKTADSDLNEVKIVKMLVQYVSWNAIENS